MGNSSFIFHPNTFIINTFILYLRLSNRCSCALFATSLPYIKGNTLRNSPRRNEFSHFSRRNEYCCFSTHASEFAHAHAGPKK